MLLLPFTRDGWNLDLGICCARQEMNSFSLSNLLVFTLHKLCSGSSNVRKYVTTCVTTCVRNSCHWSTRNCAASCPYSVQSGICGYEIKESCVMFQMLWHFRHKYCVYSYLQHFLDFLIFPYSAPPAPPPPLDLVLVWKCFTSKHPESLSLWLLPCVYSFSAVYACVPPPCSKSLSIFLVDTCSADHAGKGESCFYPCCSTGPQSLLKLNWAFKPN